VTSPASSLPAGDEQGYILIALLVLVGALASIGATFSRHVVVRAHSSSVNTSFLDAQEIVDSQIEFVVQSDRAGVPVDSSKILDAVRTEAAHHTTSLAVGDLTDDRRLIQLQALTRSGMGVTRLLEVQRIGTPKNTSSDTLPRFRESSLDALLADHSYTRHRFQKSATVTNAILEGLVIIRRGAVLTLDNVVIRGAVVSEDALDQDPFGPFEPLGAPELVIGGNVRILANDFLPGLAVLMPDGIISTANSDARVQIVGDVVSQDITLGCPGSLRGHLAIVGDPVLHVGIKLMGIGRKPMPWAPSLDSNGTFDAVSVAFVPRPLGVDDLPALTNYSLPTVGNIHDQ
jgi:hypothetical protein